MILGVEKNEPNICVQSGQPKEDNKERYTWKMNWGEVL